MSQPPQKYGPAWWVWFRTHVLLIPPGVPLSHSEKRARKQAAAQREADSTQDTLDAWTQQPAAPAPAAAAPPSEASTASGSETASSAGSWAVENERTFSSALAKVLRVVLLVALLFICVVGLRQLIFPTKSTTTVQEVQAEAFPAAAGSEVAARQVTAYLNIDPADEALAARERSLALDSSSGSSEGSLSSANVPGKQSVSNVAVVRVSQIDGTHARALVTGHLTDYTGKDGKWTAAGDPRPVAAEVQLLADETGAVSVVGRPALVATTPGPVATPPAAGAQQDTTVGTATQGAAESFFTSYGADETVTASVAPGATIAGLAGGATFDDLTGWTVYDGGGETRSALATVRWTLPSGIELTQTYTLTLSSVSADTTGGWQISAISGGGTTDQ